MAKPRITLLNLMMFWLALCVNANAAEFCKPTRIVDGDTFHYLSNGVDRNVRVSGFDALESGKRYKQELGPEATAYFAEIFKNGGECDCYKKDRYRRDVCRVYVGGENVATLMLKAGFGCIYEKYEHESLPEDRQAARAAFDFAQRNKVGMWALDNPVCPFKIRHPN